MAATGSGEGISPAVLQEAAAWFASLADAAAGEDERLRWRTWLAAHPDNARAWRRVEEVMGQLSPLVHAGGTVRGALVGPRRNRRRILGALGVLVLVGAGTATLRLRWRQWRDEAGMARADYHTQMGKVATTTLPDGSRVWLGSQGVLDMDFGQQLRRLHLYRGDLLVETANDKILPARPFVVDTLHGRLRALGTRFAVRADPGRSRIDVFDGAVELTLADAGRPAHIVRAGEQAQFDRSSLLTVGQASILHEAWTRGMLMADRMRLDALVAELSRWHPVPIDCDADVAGLQVVGAYPLGELDPILDALAASLPVRLVRETGRVRIMSAPRSSATRPKSFDAPPRRIE